MESNLWMQLPLPLPALRVLVEGRAEWKAVRCIIMSINDVVVASTKNIDTAPRINANASAINSHDWTVRL